MWHMSLHKNFMFRRLPLCEVCILSLGVCGARKFMNYLNIMLYIYHEQYKSL